MFRRPLFSILTLAFVLGCPTDPLPPEVDDPLSWDLTQPGPFGVGTASWEITYSSAGDGEDRTIPVRIWYPSEDESGLAATYEFIFPDEDSWEGATPAPAAHANGYPVLAYSHGSQGFPGGSSFLSRHFASHGWVVVAPAHIGNTLTTHSGSHPVDFYLDRPGDLSAALDSLEDGDAGLPSPIDTSRALAAGHSFGCHTMWAIAGATYDAPAIAARCAAGEYPPEQCSDSVLDGFTAGMTDPRVVASIPMAGGASTAWFGEDGLLSATIPMLYMSGTDDPGAVDGVWDRTVGLDMSWLVVEGGCHQAFGLGACPQISDAVGFRIVQSYALAFGRSHILADGSDGTTSLLDGSATLDPAASLEVR